MALIEQLKEEQKLAMKAKDQTAPWHYSFSLVSY